MSPNQAYISDTELSELEDFLLDRFDDDENPNKDEGIIDLCELDGFFAAIVSSPEMITPSVWLASLWGDFEPNWRSEKEAEKIIGLLISIMNSINSEFMDPNSQYHPLFEEREVGSIKHTIVDEWCFGYMRGVELCKQSWELDSLKMTILLAPIRTFGSYEGLENIDGMSDDEIANIKKNIVPNILEIFQFWRSDSNNSANKPVSNESFRRDTEKVGRNEPCPCGSGKKYKKCCLR